jgi:hypothetical protein
MAASKSETVLLALSAALATIAGPTISVARNVAPTQEIPSHGAVILRDGNPGETDEPLGNDGPFYYTHEAEIELMVQHGDQAVRDAQFDLLRVLVGQALDANPTLGGLINGMSYGLPETFQEAVEGAHAIKAAIVTVVMDYQSATRF